MLQDHIGEDKFLTAVILKQQFAGFMLTVAYAVRRRRNGDNEDLHKVLKVGFLLCQEGYIFLNFLIHMVFSTLEWHGMQQISA